MGREVGIFLKFLNVLKFVIRCHIAMETGNIQRNLVIKRGGLGSHLPV